MTAAHESRHTPGIRRGDRFTHRRFINADRSPLLCLVTAIRSGTLYYRPDYGLHDDGTPWLGSSWCFPLADLDKHATAIRAAQEGAEPK